MSNINFNDNGNELTVALLIDAENISHNFIKSLLEEIKSLGKITIRRVYGDFTAKNLAPWKKLCNELSVKQVHASIISPGKNNSDSALIIDAMDILHEGKVNAFCLATSDSDFTSLAIRIREEGFFVIGAGEEKSSKAFIETCDRFIRLGGTKEKKRVLKTTTSTNNSSASKKEESKVELKIEEIIDETVASITSLEDIKFRSQDILEKRGQGDYVKFATLINDLYRFFPDFDAATYGIKSNKELFSSLGFDIAHDDKKALVIRSK